ncbi:MAG: hypothetical protein HY319_19665 [Armatimonadetes bacterium]|nr:hypothetical protein [Armatimonadota bacterium]
MPGVRPASPEGEGAPTPAAKKSKKKKTAADGGEWAEAKKLCRLNAETIRKAQALGFKPRALMKNRPSPSQKWKAPLKIWIEDLYAEKFGDPKQN